ncbi:hypothetical protein GQ457_02G023770 [Hibiscus cannabinus]
MWAHVPLRIRTKSWRFEEFSMAALSDDPIQEWILTEGKAIQLTRICPVGGGCINLIKSIGPSMFEAYAMGLDAMYGTLKIHVSKLLEKTMKIKVLKI